MSIIVKYEEFQNICRICLFIGKLRPIIDSVVVEIIHGLSGTDVQIDLDLPQKICEPCYKKIYKINEFALQCKRNELTLKKCKSDYFELKNNETEAINIKEEITTEDNMLQIKQEIKTENNINISEPIEFINVANISGVNISQSQLCDETESQEEKPNNNDCAIECDPNDYKCLECNIPFNRLTDYTKHQRFHEKVTYECSVCSKKFTETDALIKHNHLHKKQYPYTCNVCNKLFRHIVSLKRHKLIHEKRKGQFDDLTDDYLDLDLNSEDEESFEKVTIKSEPIEISLDTSPILAEEEDDSDNPETGSFETTTTTTNYNENEEYINRIPPIEENSKGCYNGRRLRDRNFCMYCKTTVLNFVRHITRNHLKEPEVKKVLSTPVGSKERKNLLSLLRKRGNYIINYKTCTKPVKKTRLTKKFLPCIYCLGFYATNQLWKHRKVCVANADATSNTATRVNRPCAEAQNLLVQHLRVDETLRELVFPRMRADEVSLVAKNDALICAFGARYLKVHDPEKHIVNVTSRKMRELAKLLIALKDIDPSIENLFQSLNRKYFHLMVEAVKTVARYDEAKKMFSSPTYALQIGTALKQCCDIALTEDGVFDFIVADVHKEDIRNFITCMESNWKLIIPNPVDSMEQCQKNTIDLDSHLEETAAPILIKETEETKCISSGAKNKRVLVPWTSEQKKVVAAFFKEHIAKKRAPKKPECEALIRTHSALLQNKNWLKIKVYVQNKYSK